MIAFGNIYNGVERAWDQWLDKFEALLRTMYWFDAHVHLQTEMWGTYQYVWKSITPVPLQEGTAAMPVQQWTLTGGPRTGIRDSYSKQDT